MNDPRTIAGWYGASAVAGLIMVPSAGVQTFSLRRCRFDQDGAIPGKLPAEHTSYVQQRAISANQMLSRGLSLTTSYSEHEKTIRRALHLEYKECFDWFQIAFGATINNE
jgi:hypothetical protein